MCWLIGFATLVGLFLLGVFSSAQHRRNAPLRLGEAKTAWARNDAAETLRLLDKAFWVPDFGRFGRSDAKIALEIVQLLKTVTTARRLRIDEITRRLEGALQTAVDAADGAEVPDELIKPVRKFLASAAKDPGPLMKHLERATAKLYPAEERDPASGGEPTLSEVGLTNEIGGALASGKLDKALGLIDQHLRSANPRLRATLLSQKGGCLSTKGEKELARAAYAECVELEPDNPTHHANLAELLFELGASEEAKRSAQRAILAARTATEREWAERYYGRIV
jgi:tetratricopeptide (TPR) repeat protein